jgi:hypothetical protein
MHLDRGEYMRGFAAVNRSEHVPGRNLGCWFDHELMARKNPDRFQASRVI